LSADRVAAGFRYVDIVIGAIVAAALVWFTVTAVNSPDQRDDPGVTLIMGGIGVAILDVMLARRKMSVGELADRVGITPANLAVLKNGRAKAVRFATLAALCEALECQPGDLLRWEAEDVADEMAPHGVGVTTPGATGP
jgi:putative transcriptional regulator